MSLLLYLFSFSVKKWKSVIHYVTLQFNKSFQVLNILVFCQCASLQSAECYIIHHHHLVATPYLALAEQSFIELLQLKRQHSQQEEKIKERHHIPCGIHINLFKFYFHGVAVFVAPSAR